MSAVWMRLLVLALLAAPVGALPQKTDKKTPPKPPAPRRTVETPKLSPFVGKYEDARKLALERNVPILIHLMLEGEEASDRQRKLLTDVELTRKSAECVVIIANNGTHPKTTVEATVDGQKVRREVCSVYPMFESCSGHQLAFNDMHREFQEEGGVLRCPQTFVLTPDAKVSMRINNGGPPDAAEVVAGIAEAQTKCGPGLTQAQLDEVKKLMDVARNLSTQKSFAEAWKSWQKVLAITSKSVYADEANKESPKALEGMQKELERIVARLVPGTAVKAFQDLNAFARAVAGTPLEKDVAARIKKAESDKAIAAEISAWKLSTEADRLLVEARDSTSRSRTRRPRSPCASCSRRDWRRLRRRRPRASCGRSSRRRSIKNRRRSERP
jgi:hypothetical protein